MEENPHLFTDFAHSGVVKVKQLVGGILLPLALLGLAIQDAVAGECLVPVLRGRFNGVEWLKLSGTGVIWFAGVQVFLCLLLHARSFWRLHRTLWVYWHILVGVAGGLLAISITMTYLYLWKTHW